MIFRRYGNAYQSVEIAFDSKALNEVGFRRDRNESISADAFDGFEKRTTHELVAEAEGSVQDETEQLLSELEAHKSRICSQCKDQPCVDRVKADVQRWEKASAALTKLERAQFSEADQKRAAQLRAQIEECSTSFAPPASRIDEEIEELSTRIDETLGETWFCPPGSSQASSGSGSCREASREGASRG